jgi:membrane-bound serine protease (ClpP class)
VIGYVAPSGGHAASAGTYILYATHLAAMAPGTNLGAATPVQIGGGGLPLPGSPGKGGGSKEGGEGTEDGQGAPGDAMSAKAVNDAVAFIRSLAEMRGRNAEWAEKAVRQAASLSADAALKQGVIELVADDLDDLLAKADGRSVTLHRQQVRLATAQARVEHYEVSWQTELLAILTNPNVAFILLMLGAYGLIFEFYTPGSIGPGVVGVICLVLGLYALNLLPLNYAGLALVITGIVCMVAEAVLPSFGILGVGGLVAFVLGGILLFETDMPAYRLSWPMVIGSAVVSGGLLVFVLGYVWRAHRKPVVTGTQHLIGQEAEVLRWSGESGLVRISGERWRAEGPAGLAAGEHAVVREVRGLTLIVGDAGGEKENAP